MKTRWIAAGVAALTFCAAVEIGAQEASAPSAKQPGGSVRVRVKVADRNGTSVAVEVPPGAVDAAGRILADVVGQVAGGEKKKAQDTEKADEKKSEKKTLEPIDDPRTLVARCVENVATLKDYTCTLQKQERIDGELRPEQTMAASFRVKPHSVHIRWTSRPYKNREVIYVEGKNDGKLLVYLADMPVFKGVMLLRPDSDEALKDSLHPITMAGVNYLVKRMKTQFDKAHEAGTLKAKVVVEELGGKQTYRLERTLDDGGKRAWNVDPDTWLPVRVATWDKDDNLLESYWYRDMKTNVGLENADFDPEELW